RVHPLGLLARELLEPANYYVTEVRVQLHQECLAACLLGCDERSARTPEWVKHPLPVPGTVGDRANDQFDRLHGRAFLRPLGARDLTRVVQVAGVREGSLAH